MKKLTFFLSFIVIVSISFGQETGPKAKNYKPWKKNSESNRLVTFKDKGSVVGPKAKNKKSWTSSNTETTPITSSKKQKLTGPKAKNYKPWKN